MPQVFVYRSQAAEYAKKQDWSSFRTKQDEHGMWFAHYEPGESPAVKWLGVDFVHHVETAWDRSGDTPRKVGVLVINVTKPELDPATWDAIDREGLLVEPITPSLWSKGDDTAPTAKVRNASTGERAKSDVESPTKLVWQIADSMPGATRKDIIAACVAKGVHPSTASTQYSKWNRAKNA